MSMIKLVTKMTIKQRLKRIRFIVPFYEQSRLNFLDVNTDNLDHARYELHMTNAIALEHNKIKFWWQRKLKYLTIKELRGE